MNRLRNRLIAAFLAATLVPLAATLWITTSLLERSLGYATTEHLDRLSKALEETGREYYQRAREDLRRNTLAPGARHDVFSDANRNQWPEEVLAFDESEEKERFLIAGNRGDRLDYLVRRDGAIWRFSESLGNVRLNEMSEEYRRARELVQMSANLDLRRGFNTTLVVLVAVVWVLSFLSLIYLAHRMSKPIQRLTTGLSELAAGNLQAHIDLQRSDELGRAIDAFNNTARELQRSRDRLVYLTQIASWQTLARKMAHEVKNSLTPIRLTMEEMIARKNEGDAEFRDQAARIIVNEVETLERRVRAFSDFSSEPALHLVAVDVNKAVEERVSLLRTGHPGLSYDLDQAPSLPMAFADADHLKGILTNLLENAAEAAGTDGRILIRTLLNEGKVSIEIHDSGPGLSDEVSRTLFEPTITFKEGGMGLGLSIARKNALLCGGDLTCIDGKLGGAAFRVVLPTAGALSV